MRSLINVIDFETFGSEELKPYCCCIIINGRKFNAYGLSCVNNVLNYIYSLRLTDLVLFAHNLTFDGSIILSEMDSSWEIVRYRTIIRKGNIYSLCIKKQGFHINFRCSFKLLPIELAEIAYRLKISKKLDFDHSIVAYDTYNKKGIRNMVIAYCERDTEIVNQFLVKMSLSLNKYIKNWYLNCYSISGIAYKIYKEYFNVFKIPLSLDIDLDNIIRKAYYGGRCEVFGNPYKDEYIYHFDFTGMYSNRLKDFFPVGDPKKIIKPLDCSKPGFYYVRVKSSMSLPILPYRCINTGKLLFPNGVFSGLYWYEEILLFIREGGELLEIEWGLEYSDTKRIFLDFAEHCIENRKNSDIDNILWKMIPNSFIGRLGLKNDNETTLILDDFDYDPRSLDVISDKRINDKWIVRIRDYNNKNTVSNVTYSAIVTAKSRIVWWEHANMIIKDGGRILYCDTDSLFIAFKDCRLGFRWGEVFLDPSKKDTIIEKACFACSKAYSVILKDNKITKIKGIPKKKTLDMGFDEFEVLFTGDAVKKIKMDYFRKKNLKIKIEEIFKIIRVGSYDKRIFIKDKKETKALIINN